MKKIYLIALLISLYFFGHSQAHVYQFSGNLLESNGNGPALTETLSCAATSGSLTSQVITTTSGNCGTGAQQVFAFNEGGGLSYPNAAFISGSYTIHIFFEFNSLSGYQRILDFKNSTTDRGMYILNNCLNFYPNGNVGTCPYFLPNTFYLISIVRDAATNLVNVYVDGTLFVTDYNDVAGDYSPTTNTTPVIFFRDDNAVTCEDRDGTVKYISLQGSTSTPAQVQTVFNNICALVLPLDLTSFTASGVAGTNKALLKWKTENEINSDHFLIERSTDGVVFESVGQVKAIGTGQNSYSFTDQLFSHSPLFYYRLKIMDKDLQFKYSEVRSVNIKFSETLSAYPNPATTILLINSFKKEDVVISNSMGQVIENLKLNKGINKVTVSDWPIGLYFIKSSEGTLRFVKN